MSAPSPDPAHLTLQGKPKICILDVTILDVTDGLVYAATCIQDSQRIILDIIPQQNTPTVIVVCKALRHKICFCF